MFESSWREKAQNNILGAIDLAESFGGSKNVYLKKLNQSLRRQINAQREVSNVTIYQRLENLVDVRSRFNRNRDSGVAFREAEIYKLDDLRRKRIAA